MARAASESGAASIELWISIALGIIGLLEVARRIVLRVREAVRRDVGFSEMERIYDGCCAQFERSALSLSVAATGARLDLAVTGRDGGSWTVPELVNRPTLPERPPRFAVIHGPRGSGKTSFLLAMGRHLTASLAEAMQDENLALDQYV